jgi:apolipoprotein N-acyltransferase
MKTTPAASPSPSTAASSPAATRTTATAATSRPASVVDYRTNVERQSREQKSVGGILSILVYSLIGLFVLGAGLASYGAYVVHQALHDQSVTVGQLEARYDQENKDLNARLATTLDTLTSAQAQVARQQELILKQQEAINKLLTATQENATDIRQEKASRSQETANIRARLKNLEYQGPTTRKY